MISINKYNILSIKERHELHDSILNKRLEKILPYAMKKAEVECWVVLSREYNEDPVFYSLMPSKALSAGRYSALLFIRDIKKDKVEKYICSRSHCDVSEYYDILSVDKGENFLDVISRKIKEKNPKNVALNFSWNMPLSDGLSHSEYKKINEKLEIFKDKIISAQELVTLWMETRTKKEMDLYENLNYIAHGIINEVFSKKNVIAGYTRTGDLEYLLWQKAIDNGLEVWFSPDVNLQREGGKNRFITGKILPGDLLHCDYGIKYLDLCTDTQRLAYVKKNSQNDIPHFLKELMKTGNDVQNILSEEFKIGLTGNEILKNTLKKCEENKIKAQIYSHPVGFYGHGAGPAIGMYDNQKKVPVKGEIKIENNTCYAMELNASKRIPEWNNEEYYAFLEQTIGIIDDEVVYFDGRQKKIILI